MGNLCICRAHSIDSTPIVYTSTANGNKGVYDHRVFRMEQCSLGPCLLGTDSGSPVINTQMPNFAAAGDGKQQRQRMPACAQAPVSLRDHIECMHSYDMGPTSRANMGESLARSLA